MADRILRLVFVPHVCFLISAPQGLKCQRAGKALGSDSDLEVVVAGQGNEEVEKETLAVFVDLWSVVVQTCSVENMTS